MDPTLIDGVCGVFKRSRFFQLSHLENHKNSIKSNFRNFFGFPINENVCWPQYSESHWCYMLSSTWESQSWSCISHRQVFPHRSSWLLTTPRPGLMISWKHFTVYSLGPCWWVLRHSWSPEGAVWWRTTENVQGVESRDVSWGKDL